jgi:hypothetical protein
MSFRFFYAWALITGFLILVAFAGRVLPNEALNLFPLAVFLSPLPMG